MFFQIVFDQVHRVLLAALGDLRSFTSSPDHSDSNPDEVLFTPDQLNSICNHMNEQHWAVQQVQRSSIELFQCLFFLAKSDDDPIRFSDGIISQLRGSNGFVVLVPRCSIINVFFTQYILFVI